MTKILFLAANPLDTDPLRLGDEMRAIDSALQQAKLRDQFVVESHWAARVDDLQALLLRHQPDIVHFSGHGSDASEIVLQDADGRSVIVPGNALSQLFRVLCNNIRCVVLNACYSAEQAAGIGAEIDTVIGMSDAISDDAARSFAAAFYRGLCYGKSVAIAFDLGCNAIDLAALNEGDMPTLMGRVDASDVYFSHENIPAYLGKQYAVDVRDRLDDQTAQLNMERLSSDRVQSSGPSIYLSYARTDSEFAEWLAMKLREKNHTVFMTPGRSLDLQQSRDSGSILLAILSPAYLMSTVRQAEWRYFLSSGGAVIGLQYKPCDIPTDMHKSPIIDWIESPDTALSELDFHISSSSVLSPQLSDRSSIAVLSAISGEVVEESLELTWDSVDERIRPYLKKMIGVRYREKYDDSYYSERKDLVASYQRFMSSSKTIMAITGKSGTGKSCFVCDITKKQEEDVAIWLQDCAQLESEGVQSLEQHIMDTIGYSDLDLETVIRQLAEEQPNRKILFIFDAVNEHSESSSLLTQISEFATNLSKYSSAKVLVTCRMPHWSTIRRFFTVPGDIEFRIAGPDSHVEVQPFRAQEIEEVYEKYRRAYEIQTRYADLSEHVSQFITEPLLLKLMAIAHRGGAIPPTLAIRDVFRRYVNYCLGHSYDGEQDVYQTQEYKVLSRAIELMYENASRYLELGILQSDGTVGELINSDLATLNPYSNLVNEGLLSQRVDDDLWRRIQIVYVTYERVFEYLLASVVIRDTTTESVLELLEIAKERSFIQLRGALELALALSIMRDTLPVATIVEIARNDRPESRQFLCDVIQTVYISGYRDKAELILKELIAEQNHATSILAIQAAFQLQLDDYLVDLSLNDDDSVVNAAILFIYQRWNKERLANRLEDAYRPIWLIADRIRIIRPRQSVRALWCLTILTVYLTAHLVDDRDSLLPLFDIWKSIANRFPGVNVNPSGSMSSRATQKVLNGFIDILIKGSPAVARFLPLDLLDEFWQNPANRRVFMDVTILRGKENLVDHVDGVRKLIEWDNTLPPYISPNPLIHHLFYDLENSSEALGEIFIFPEKYPFRARFMVTYATAWALAFRLIRGKSVPSQYQHLLNDYFAEMWSTAHELNAESGELRYVHEGTIIPTIERSIGQVVMGIYLFEVTQQKAAGRVTGSTFLKGFLRDEVSRDITDSELGSLVETLQSISYRGVPEFSVYTLLDADIRARWERQCPEIAVRVLAHIRCFYQDEVDSILQEDSENNADLFARVRLVGAIPSLYDVLPANSAFWILGSAIDGGLTKIIGVTLVDIVSVDKVEDLLRRSAKTFMTILFNFDVINVAALQWYLAHDENWSKYDDMQIDEDLINRHPKLHAYWKKEFEQFIDKYGKGIFYDEL